jgi:serine/threonine-protein kinase
VDSSFPVLVSRLADKRALTRLVRAALNNEVAEVPLSQPPQRSEAHTLDLHVAGQPPLALMAEPEGVGQNGHFQLRLKPLYRGQTAQLHALLEGEPPEEPPPPPPNGARPSHAPAAPWAADVLEPPDPDELSLSVNVVFDEPEAFVGPPSMPPPTNGAPAPTQVSPGVVPASEQSHEDVTGGSDVSLSTSETCETSEEDLSVHVEFDAPEPEPAPEAFFDEALSSLPPPVIADEIDAAAMRAPLPSSLDVGVEEVELLDQTPRRGVRAALPSAIDSDSDDATLVKVSKAVQEVLLAKRRQAKDKDARSRSKTTQQKAPGDVDDAADTAALRKPPVAPPPPADATPAEIDPIVGRQIADGKYIIDSLIGSGASGAVYRAQHRELRRTVAIKLLHPHYQRDPEFMSSFRGEALAASQLDHPNVMRVLDFGQEGDGLVYIVMEYLSGRTLQSLLDEERRLPAERAVELMIQVCAALSVAHDHGIIHRDIKPDNIMLVPSRNDEGATFELVKVCDFGIAALEFDKSERGVIAGTPEYMSPEQATGGDVDARSDVYACGICLYELVTGRPPFIGDKPGEILLKQLEETPRPPSQIIKGLDPLLEEVIVRAIQKEPTMRHQSARELRVELKELIDPGESFEDDNRDDRSIVEDVPGLDDPASGFPGFFIAFASAILRFGRFERGHPEQSQAMKELQKSLRLALRGRGELTLARRDIEKAIGFCVMSGSAEVVDLRRLLGSQLYGSFGEPFIAALVNKGIAALTLREGSPDSELALVIDWLLGPLANDELRLEILAKPLREVSFLFVSDVVGRDRKLIWKVGLCLARLSRDLRALCTVRGISLKKMRETRDELVGGVARLLTRADEVKQFISNSDLVDGAVANLRGFSSFQVTPLIIERVLHDACAETAASLLADFDDEPSDETHLLIELCAQRLVTERSTKSDAVVAELYRRKIVTEDDMPRDLKETVRAQTLADELVRDPSQVLHALDALTDDDYENEVATLEAAMAVLARRAEAIALLSAMSALARQAKGRAPELEGPREESQRPSIPVSNPGRREKAALRTMKAMIDSDRLLPVATALLLGPAHQREAAHQLVVLAGSAGAAALYLAREQTIDPAARPAFVAVMRETGVAGWTILSQVLPRAEVRDDAELALVEDLLRAIPEHADPALGEHVAKFLSHPVLRPAALSALATLWGERAKKPLVDALEYAEEPTRVVALGELRRLRAIDEYVVGVIERFLTMRGSAGEDLRASAATALCDVALPLRSRAVQLLSKAVEGKRGIVAMLRGDGNGDETLPVLEAMSRALMVLDRTEGTRAIRSRLSRSDGPMKAMLSAVLHG